MNDDTPPARIRIRANPHPEWTVPLTSNVTDDRLRAAQAWARTSVDVIERFVADAQVFVADTQDLDKRESLRGSYSEVLHFLRQGEALWNDLGAALDQAVIVVCWGSQHSSHFAVLLGSLSRIWATAAQAGLGQFLCGWDFFATLKQLVGGLALPSPRGYVASVLTELSRAASERSVAPHTVTLAAEPVTPRPAPPPPGSGDGDGEQTAAGAITEAHLSRLAQVIGDDNAPKILALVYRADLSGEKKFEELLRLDSRFGGKNSREWGILLGVKPDAVRGYAAWKQLQAKKRCG
jgi:hypothetical protein